MKRAIGIFVVISILSILILTGCSSAPQSENTHTLRIGWMSEPDTLNPLVSYSTESMQITGLVYESLIAYDTDLEPYCRLAESYEYSDDRLVATYHLRHGVKWHDGEDFNADDVVMSFNMLRDYRLGTAAPFVGALEDTVAVDEYTVEVHYSEKQAFNLAAAILILPEHIWGGMSLEDVALFANSEPIGTGPMRFADWTEGTTITLSRNEDYYGTPAGPGRIVFVQYGNEDVMAQALKSGEIDIVTEISPTVWEGLEGVENIKTVELNSFSFHEIGINSNESSSSKGNPMLRDLAVRQALNYIADRGKIIEIALAGHGELGDTIIPVGMGDWHYSVPVSDQMNGDIEKARTILEQAGYVDSNGDGIREKDGRDMDFRLFAIESTTVDVRAAQIFRDAALEAGVKITLTTMDENTMGNAIFDTENSDFDLFVWGWDTNVMDPGDLLSIPVSDQIGNNNDVYYVDAAYDELYEMQSKEIDDDARKQLCHELQKKFYQDGSYIVLWFQNKLQAYRTDTWIGWVECDGGVIYNVTYDNYTAVQPVSG